MCSRFENKETGLSIFTKINKYYDINNLSINTLKKINIAPTDDIMVINKENEELALSIFSWGIKFPKSNIPIIFNSRIETINSKPFWGNLFEKNRCLIPATAFYEWKSFGKIKIPQRITFNKLEVFYIAGIYLSQDNQNFVSFITTNANSSILRIHNRMPVIFDLKTGIEFLLHKNSKSLQNFINMENLNDVEIETADEILTQNQKDFLRNKGNKN